MDPKLPCHTKKGCPSTICCDICTLWHVEEWERFALSHAKLITKQKVRPIYLSLGSLYGAVYVVPCSMAEGFKKKLDHEQTAVFELIIDRARILNGGNFPCVFLTKDKKCLVYANRPSICRRIGTEISCPKFLVR